MVHTCSAEPRVSCPGRKNFTPLLSEAMPKYPEQKLVVPPVAQILEWADRQQFDAIHVHTPGPMGLCGWLVAKMLRVPVLMTYHTDFPRYVRDLTGDHRLTSATEAYMTWFFGQAHTIFSRSKDYCGKLRGLGLGDKRLEMVLPGVDTEKFSPEMRDVNLWPKLRVGQTHKLLYAGRVSVEKNLPFLVECFRRLCRLRQDVALVVAGDGPYRVEMDRRGRGGGGMGQRNQRPAERRGATHADEPHGAAPGGAVLARADVRGLLERARAGGRRAGPANQGERAEASGGDGVRRPGSQRAGWRNALTSCERKRRPSRAQV